jgi:hypothetical protein
VLDQDPRCSAMLTSGATGSVSSVFCRSPYCLYLTVQIVNVSALRENASVQAHAPRETLSTSADLRSPTAFYPQALNQAS